MHTFLPNIIKFTKSPRPRQETTLVMNRARVNNILYRLPCEVQQLIWRHVMNRCISEFISIVFHCERLAPRLQIQNSDPDCGCNAIPYWKCRRCSITLCYFHYVRSNTRCTCTTRPNSQQQ